MWNRLGNVENMVRNQTISISEKEMCGNVGEEPLKLPNALLVWKFKVTRCLEYFDWDLEYLQIRPFLNHWNYFEKNIKKWGCIMKTNICNNNYGHLKSCDLNYQSDYWLGHFNDDLKKSPFVIKLDMWLKSYCQGL